MTSPQAISVTWYKNMLPSFQRQSSRERVRYALDSVHWQRLRKIVISLACSKSLNKTKRFN